MAIARCCRVTDSHDFFRMRAESRKMCRITVLPVGWEMGTWCAYKFKYKRQGSKEDSLECSSTLEACTNFGCVLVVIPGNLLVENSVLFVDVGDVSFVRVWAFT